MRYIIINLVLILVSMSCYGQSDTLYIAFSDPDQVVSGFKHKNDTSENYPFDGGRIYRFHKKVGNFTKELRFFFRSYTPEWMDQQFEYEIVDESILHEKDFKDRDWFDKTDYIDILKIFNEANVIYLIDENYIKNGKAYMVRVYFNYSAEE